MLFAGLAVFNTEKNYPAIMILLVMAVFQVAEPRVRTLSSPRGQIAASAIKLTLAYLLIGFTDGVQSNYYAILFVPIISAATSLELLGTFVFIALACASYLSFLLFVDWQGSELTADAINTLSLRCTFVSVVGFLVYQQAKAKRERCSARKKPVEAFEERKRRCGEASAWLRWAN